jgi:membrane-bound lytic murein transglycosylase D
MGLARAPSALGAAGDAGAPPPASSGSKSAHAAPSSSAAKPPKPPKTPATAPSASSSIPSLHSPPPLAQSSPSPPPPSAPPPSPSSLPSASASASTPTSNPGSAFPSLHVAKSEVDDKSAAKAKPHPKPPPVKPTPRAARSPTDAVRRTVSGSAESEGMHGVETPELAAIREADEELFHPSPSPNQAPWAADLPPSITLDPTRPVIRASGVPPSAPLAPQLSAETGRDFAWLRELSLPELPVRWDARVVRYLDYYRCDARGKNLVQAWVRKSGRYGAAMRRVLHEQGLPDDLMWVSLIESGFDPQVRSSAGAAGLWQLMPEGARAYGLVVDRWIDERLDPERSTEAAARYLHDLHRRFGAWELALAAYNMGYGGLLAAIRKYNTNDYWELSKLESGIPYETALYVPKIIALAVASKNSATFGLETVKVDPPVTFDTVPVPSGVSLKAIAAAAGSDVSSVEALNPQLKSARTPPEAPSTDATTWMVRVPLGKGTVAIQALAEKAAKDKKFERYATKLGDSVDSIALSRSTTRARLVELNALRQDESLRPGTVLLLPPAEGSRPAPPPTSTDEKPLVVVPADTPDYVGRKRVFYRVMAGDSLHEISNAFRVTPDDLRRWNALDPSARLHEGMTLQVFVEPSVDLSKVVHLAESEVRCVTVGSDEFFAHFEGLKNRKRTTIAVEEGDTWEKIAKRYGLTVGQLERINQRSRTDKLVAKETLVVYAPTGRAVAHEVNVAASGGPQPLTPAAAPSPDDLPTVPEPTSSGGGATSNRSAAP